ncbi:hypothetical protein ACXR8V_10240, partial [Pseudomonas aeruginosa]
LMHRYNWIRPHQFNDGLPPAVAEEKLNPLSGMGRPLHLAQARLSPLKKLEAKSKRNAAEIGMLRTRRDSTAESEPPSIQQRQLTAS